VKPAGSLRWAFRATFALLALLAQPSARAVTLIHTNDILGELEPCGCRSNPLGGMAREYHLLERISDPEKIVLDGGDVLFQTENVPDLLKKQSELQARYLLQAMNRLHYDAVVVGEKDLALGLPIFKSLKKETSIHFLAANLKVAGPSPFENHVILKRKTPNGGILRVGVFGVTSPEVHWPKGVRALPYLAVAKREVAYLKKHSDLVVALSHLGLDEDKKLVAAVKGIDLVIGGHSQSFLQTPIQIDSTWIFQSSFRNQYVGAIPLSIPFASTFKPDSYQLTGLDAGYDSAPEAPTEIDTLVKEFKTAIAKLNSAEEITQTAAVTHSTEPTYQTFPRCAECHLKQFDFWRHTAHAGALEALVDKDQFLNKDCLTCHTVGAGKPNGWHAVKELASVKVPDAKDETLTHDEVLGTPDLIAYLKAVHTADTFKSMVKIHSASNPQEAALPLNRSLNQIAQMWTPVQCENCHQPGGDHPFTAGYSKKVENSTCLSCHTLERAPEWWDKGKPRLDLIEAKRKLVTCPAGDLEDTN
jgi:hypothetical protein